MKPSGIVMTVGGGGIGLSLRQSSRAEDAIWEAVEQAIAAGWTPSHFKNESASAWVQLLKDAAKEAASELTA